MAADLLTLILTVALAALVIGLIAYLAKSQNQKSSSDQNSDEESEQTAPEQNGKVVTQKKTTSAKGKQKSATAVTFSHPWLLTSLKGHSGRVLDVDFSSNGKHLVSCGEDRTLMLWSVKDFSERDHKSVRGQVEYDHAKLVNFAPDCKSIVLCLDSSNTLAVYKLIKKEEGAGGYKFQPVDNIEFPSTHIRDIMHIGISCTGKKRSMAWVLSNYLNKHKF